MPAQNRLLQRRRSRKDSVRQSHHGWTSSEHAEHPQMSAPWWRSRRGTTPQRRPDVAPKRFTGAASAGWHKQPSRPTTRGATQRLQVHRDILTLQHLRAMRQRTPAAKPAPWVTVRDWSPCRRVTPPAFGRTPRGTRSRHHEPICRLSSSLRLGASLFRMGQLVSVFADLHHTINTAAQSSIFERAQQVTRIVFFRPAKPSVILAIQ